MRNDADARDVEGVCAAVRAVGGTPRLVRWAAQRLVVSADLARAPGELTDRAGVRRVVQPSGDYRLTSREFRAMGTVVEVGGIGIGGSDFVVIAGPCAVESGPQLHEISDAVAEAGAAILRGGAFKPRTSPYSFQGLGRKGLRLLDRRRRQTGLPVVTEVMQPDHVEMVAASSDVLQIGTRNMQNFPLLKEVGRSRRPVLLKRGMCATVKEWLLAAEYVMAEGNPHVVLCERGIRTFEPASRFTLDLSAVPIVRRHSHLPVLIDPSHATGHAYLVGPMTLAAAAAGADGVMIDVHTDRAAARCDGSQALRPAEFKTLMADLERLLSGFDRRIAQPPPTRYAARR
ncbi:3-deoxy-7-phosphoheptulonate synthase [Actinomadura sp. SCN-SB]|uniref:3-deoxy-7-phosphoheptulonate synthase n=1 Tax=Actinomadura sp. SCN-SB TaxID=3373092 RepID=UPI0037521E4A